MVKTTRQLENISNNSDILQRKPNADVFDTKI